MGDADDESPPMVLEEDSREYRIVNKSVRAKLMEMFPDIGIDDPDNVLCEYIQVLLCNRKPKSQVIDDLEPFLDDGARRFTAWLWDYLRFLADSFQERPRLAANRSKSVARAIDLIHDDKRKRQREDDDYHRPQGQHPAGRPHSGRSCRRQGPAVTEVSSDSDDGASIQQDRADIPAARPLNVRPQPLPMMQYAPEPQMFAGPTGAMRVPGPDPHGFLVNSGSSRPSRVDTAPLQPNRRPTWLPKDKMASREADDDSNAAPTRFVITFRGVPMHETGAARQVDNGITAGNGSRGVFSDTIRPSFGNTDRPRPVAPSGLSISLRDQRPAPAVPLSYGTPLVTLQYGSGAVGAVPAPLTYGNGALPSGPLVYTSASRPTAAALAQTLIPTLGMAGMMLPPSFIPANNSLGIHTRSIISSLHAQPAPTPAFKRMRPGDASLVVDFDDDEGTDGWGQRNVDVMSGRIRGRRG